MTASNNLSEAQALVRERANIEAFQLDVSDEIKLGEAVSAADVVVRRVG
jgi:saccharopine dehydrogenase-like NADP-dependent oxidoreductase